MWICAPQKRQSWKWKVLRLPIFIIYISSYLDICMYAAGIFGCWLAVSLKWKIAQFSIYNASIYMYVCMYYWCIVSSVSLCCYIQTFNIIIFNFITANTNISNNIIITFAAAPHVCCWHTSSTKNHPHDRRWTTTALLAPLLFTLHLSRLRGTLLQLFFMLLPVGFWPVVPLFYCYCFFLHVYL